jgi:parvulin-like peptidyl-prolyl cis-trans isomerase-like protein
MKIRKLVIPSTFASLSAGYARDVQLIAVLAALLSLSACDGLREALTAHTDVAARAESQELSVNRMGDLLGNSALQIPVNRETAGVVSDLWVSYQLLGVAAARGDTNLDPKLIDEATLGVTANARLRRYMEGVSKTFKADSASESTYNQAAGGIFVARHILFPVPGGATQQQKDSVRRKAEGVRAQLTSANFAAMAKKYSADPGSAQRGGDLGAFPRGDMVKPFGDAVAALKPGEISPLVETSFGYHIIQRPTYANARAQYDSAYTQSSMARAESLFIAKIDDDANINVKANAATAAKAAARDMPAHREDDNVLATFKGGQLTTGKFVRWLESFGTQMRIPQQMVQAPDTLVKQFVKSIARNEVMLKKADSAGVVMTPEEKQQLYSEFKQLQGMLWQQLGVEPRMLRDSAKTAPERERLAAKRIDSYLDAIMAGQAQPLQVPTPLQRVLLAKYKAKTYPAGVDRGLEQARKLRTVADSTRAAQQPRSQVPLPTPPADSAARSKRP